MRRAALRLSGWVASALAAGFVLSRFLGPRSFHEYLTVYLIELSMSFDNLIVLAAAVAAVPAPSRGRVLRLGLLGAVVLRLVLVLAGLGLVERLSAAFYVFGAFLILVGLGTASPALDVFRPAKVLLSRLGSGRPLLPEAWRGPVVVGSLAVIGYDAMFALDSVPAALAVSRSWPVVFAANFFSVMGLGELYSMLGWLEERFALLPKGVALVLIFIGAKMILEPLGLFHLSSGASLGVIAAILGSSAALSLAARRAA